MLLPPANSGCPAYERNVSTDLISESVARLHVSFFSEDWSVSKAGYKLIKLVMVNIKTRNW